MKNEINREWPRYWRSGNVLWVQQRRGGKITVGNAGKESRKQSICTAWHMRAPFITPISEQTAKRLIRAGKKKFTTEPLTTL